MLLLTGPPGSGKTRHLVRQFLESAGRGAANVRLLTPTATMAEHFRNELARRGLFLRPRSVQTLHQFVRSVAAGPRRVPSVLLQFYIGQVLDQAAPPAFAGLRAFPGFRRAMANLVEELTLAGGAAERLRTLLRQGVFAAEYAEAILEVFTNLERLLAGRGLALRADHLREAARRVLAGALARQAEVTVTLPEWDGAARAHEALAAAGFQVRACRQMRRRPQTLVFTAPSPDREAAEIARRILRAVQTGRLFREIGIIVRGFDPYVPALRTTLRFGIPARFYFAAPLGEHPAVRRIGLLVEAALGGWDHEKLLRAVLMAPSTASLDRFEFAVRERLPGQDLETFGEPDGAAPPGNWLATLRRLDSWRESEVPPREWVRRLASLGDLFPPPEIRDGVTHEQAGLWRDAAAARQEFNAVLEALPELLGEARAVSLSTFWAQAQAVLQLSAHRPRDHRRNVVHVMDAYEARQWELPLVFVCGLLEKQFPRYHHEDPLLPDAARQQLRLGGIHLRTSRERDLEERFLFHLVTTRATGQLVLSYPSYNAAGEENLPSFLLQEFLEKENPAVEEAQGARPASPRAPAPPPRPAISDAALRDRLGAKAARLSVTAIESFLQCPFQFFAAEVLELRERPVAPGERFDPLVQGTIVHRVLAEWILQEQPIEPLFHRVFAEECARSRIPPGYRTEAVRLEMLESLRRILDSGEMRRWEKIHAEQAFEIAIAGQLCLTGRIDRLDVDARGRARLIDYKYSRPDRIGAYIREHEAGQRVQAGIYLRAAREIFGCEPVAMQFCACRGKVKWRGWSQPAELNRLKELAAGRALAAASQIREGRIEPAPADPAKCEWCACRDVCRVEMAVPAARSGGGSA